MISADKAREIQQAAQNEQDAYRFPETSTIFFRIENGQITGGVYEMSIGSRSQSVIVVPRDKAKASDYNVYAYEQQDVEAIIKCIEEAK